MKKYIKHTEIVEPIHEYFVTICKWCGEELPEELDEWWGNVAEPGDVCPYCGKPLMEEMKE